MKRCGCFHGGPCTRTTVCAVENATEELRDQLDAVSSDLTVAREWEETLIAERDRYRAWQERAANLLPLIPRDHGTDLANEVSELLRAAREQTWTCSFCGTVNSGNFCATCQRAGEQT